MDNKVHYRRPPKDVREIWRCVPHYNGRYMVSNLYRVKSMIRESPIIMKQSVDKQGFPYVNLHATDGSAKRYRIYQLVSLVFSTKPAKPYNPFEYRTTYNPFDNESKSEN